MLRQKVKRSNIIFVISLFVCFILSKTLFKVGAKRVSRLYKYNDFSQEHGDNRKHRVAASTDGYGPAVENMKSFLKDDKNTV